MIEVFVKLEIFRLPRELARSAVLSGFVEDSAVAGGLIFRGIGIDAGVKEGSVAE